MSARSSAALARSYRGQRLLVALIGLLALAAGALALVVGQGWLGQFRATRPVLDPIAINWLRGQADLSRGVAIGVGVVLFVLGLIWFFRSLRPERHPDVVLDDTEDAGLTVTSGALTEAVAIDAENLEGVSKARVRAVGRPGAPALRISLWLVEGADLRQVWHELDTEVLRHAKESLGVERLPTAVRVELESGSQQRVR